MTQTVHLVRPRPPEQSPFSSSCRLALRRICGVCAHFDGASMRDAGTCLKFSAAVTGPQSAAGCDLWSRKLAKAVRDA